MFVCCRFQIPNSKFQIPNSNLDADTVTVRFEMVDMSLTPFIPGMMASLFIMCREFLPPQPGKLINIHDLLRTLQYHLYSTITKQQQPL